MMLFSIEVGDEVPRQDDSNTKIEKGHVLTMKQAILHSIRISICQGIAYS